MSLTEQSDTHWPFPSPPVENFPLSVSFGGGLLETIRRQGMRLIPQALDIHAEPGSANDSAALFFLRSVHLLFGDRSILRVCKSVIYLDRNLTLSPTSSALVPPTSATLLLALSPNPSRRFDYNLSSSVNGPVRPTATDTITGAAPTALFFQWITGVACKVCTVFSFDQRVGVNGSGKVQALATMCCYSFVLRRG